MQNMKTEIQNSEIVTPKIEVTKIDKATLKAVATKVVKTKTKAKKEVERKTKTKDKNFIYKFQIASKRLSDKDAKKYRNKLRRKMQNIVNSIIVSKDKKESIKDFIKIYKQEYILNDFTIESISNSSDETKQEDFTKVLSLVKSSFEKK